MEKQYTFLWEVTAWEFVFVTVILAGGAAWLTGRATAKSWESNIQLVAYIVLLAAATRFIHFALFQGTLLSLHYYIVDFVILLAVAFLGRQRTRTKQMATQYGFDYRKKGVLSWGRNGTGSP
jgi:hypothetical protein